MFLQLKENPIALVIAGPTASGKTQLAIDLAKQSNKNILIVFHGNSCRALLMEILNISKEKIVEFEIPTGNPLLIKFEKNLKVIDCKYLDDKRSRKILFNV